MDKRDAHLSNDELLQSIDGELPEADAARVERHLSACWSCRGRRDRQERKVSDFTLYRERMLAPDLPPSAGGRAKFLAAVDEQLMNAEPAGLVSKVRSVLGLRASFASLGVPRIIALACGVLVIAWIGAAPAAAAMGRMWEYVRSAIGESGPTLPPAPAAPRLTHLTPIPALPPVDVSPVPAPRTRRSVNLVDLELEALRRLHQAGALTGEEVEIGRDATDVWVRARVETAARRRELRRALAAVADAGARVQVETYEEATARQKATPTTARLHDMAAVAEKSLATATLTAHFASTFGSEADPRVAPAVRDFSARTLRQARQITLNSFALRRVCEGFSPTALAQASDAARVAHSVLVREYAGLVEGETAQLIRDLVSVFGRAQPEAPAAPDESMGQLVRTTSELEETIEATFAVQIGSAAAVAPDGARFIVLARTAQQAAAGVRVRGCHQSKIESRER